MAADNLKHYFPRAWENDSGHSMSEPWRHDYATNIVTFGICFLALNIATWSYLQAVQYVLLNNFPGLADRLCYVKPGRTQSRMEDIGWLKILVGAIGPYIGRFVYEPLFAHDRMHFWEWCTGILAASLVGYGLVLILVALVALLCRAGDKLNRVTGWQSHDNSSYYQGSHRCDGTCGQAGHGKPQSQSQPAMEEQIPNGTRNHHDKQPQSPETLPTTKQNPTVDKTPAGIAKRVHGVLTGWSPRFKPSMIEARAALSPLPEHLSYHSHNPASGQMEAYQTITAVPDHPEESQEELRLKHYQEQEQMKAEAAAESKRAAGDVGTAWLRARQFANSIFSNSTSTAASHDSFGKSSLGQRGLLVDVGDGDKSVLETTPPMETDIYGKQYT